MAIPKYHDLCDPTLQVLKRLGGSASIKELDEVVIEMLHLTEAEFAQSHPPDNRQTEIEYRLAWARTYLKLFGIIENAGRGIWILTAKGNEASKIDPYEMKQFMKQIRTAKQQLVEEPTLVDLSSDSSTVAQTVLEQSWKDHLLATLRSMAPDAFERLCQRLLRESGFVEVKVTGRTGDGGIDGVGRVKIGGLLGFPIVFQCKRYQGSVGSNVVREFRGAMMGRADRGLILTTGTFTRDARQEATRDGVPPIDLLDGDELMDKLKELRLGVTVQMIEEVSVNTHWFGAI